MTDFGCQCYTDHRSPRGRGLVGMNGEVVQVTLPSSYWEFVDDKHGVSTACRQRCTSDRALRSPTVRTHSPQPVTRTRGFCGSRHPAYRPVLKWAPPSGRATEVLDYLNHTSLWPRVGESHSLSTCGHRDDH